VWLLNQLKNDQDEILIPGYYDEVLPPNQVDLELLEKVPFDKEEYCRIYEIDDILPGTDGTQALCHLLFRPTATINGLTSGYQGVGNKTIIPNEARVKLDFRFVKNQDPVECAKKIKGFFINTPEEELR
jgi:acetylornithine deacetylase/succinyl-diaminopimelate desuccinylase-like protein